MELDWAEVWNYSDKAATLETPFVLVPLADGRMALTIWNGGDFGSTNMVLKAKDLRRLVAFLSRGLKEPKKRAALRVEWS